MTDVWGMLAQADLKLGDERGSAQGPAAIRPALAAKPGGAHGAGGVLPGNRPVRARAETRGSGRRERGCECPRIAGADRVAAGDWATAEREAEAALKESPDRRRPRLIIGPRQEGARRPGRGPRRSRSRPEPVGEGETAPSLQPELSARRCPGAPGTVGRGGGRLPRGDPRLSLVSAPVHRVWRCSMRARGRGSRPWRPSETLVRLKTPEALFAAARDIRDPGGPRQRRAPAARGAPDFPRSAGASADIRLNRKQPGG